MELAPILHQSINLGLPPPLSQRGVVLSPKRLSFLSTLPRSEYSSTRLRSVSSFCHNFPSPAIDHLMIHSLPSFLFAGGLSIFYMLTCQGGIAFPRGSFLHCLLTFNNVRPLGSVVFSPAGDPACLICMNSAGMFLAFLPALLLHFPSMDL